MRVFARSVIVSVSVLAAAPAFAQALQVEKNVSMALSMAMMQGALDQCTKDGFKVSVVVVDRFLRGSEFVVCHLQMQLRLRRALGTRLLRRANRGLGIRQFVHGQGRAAAGSYEKSSDARQ